MSKNELERKRGGKTDRERERERELKERQANRQERRVKE